MWGSKIQLCMKKGIATEKITQKLQESSFFKRREKRERKFICNLKLEPMLWAAQEKSEKLYLKIQILMRWKSDWWVDQRTKEINYYTINDWNWFDFQSKWSMYSPPGVKNKGGRVWWVKSSEKLNDDININTIILKMTWICFDDWWGVRSSWGVWL